MDSEDQNTTNGALSDDELKSLNGSEEDSSNDAINFLHREITSLRKDRSELQAKISALLSELEQSEVQTKAVAAHASYMEGELMKTQEDLISASSLAEDAENEKKRLVIQNEELRTEVNGLKERVTDLEIEKGRKDEDTGILKEKVLNLEEEKGALEAEIEAIRENERTRASKDEEVEKMMKTIKDRNLELEKDLICSMNRKDQEFELDGVLKENDEVDQKNREMNFAASNAMCSARVNWGVVAAAAASTGAVAVIVTMLCLRQKQH